MWCVATTAQFGFDQTAFLGAPTLFGFTYTSLVVWVLTQLQSSV